MNKLIAMLFTALFVSVSFTALAADDMKKPTAEECKKNPKMKGCEQMKK